jgi:hypothetical protein
MNRLNEKILIEIFLHIDSLDELLRVSSVCRQWRKIILAKDFFQNRFVYRRNQYLIKHWKFDKILNVPHHSNNYFERGYIQQEKCFLGSCLLFDAHSSLTIPLKNCQSEQFTISLWVKKTKLII